MSLPRAADLPAGSQIRYQGRVIEHRGPLTIGPRWRDGGNSYLPVEIDWLLNDGAEVLRVGDGSGT